MWQNMFDQLTKERSDVRVNPKTIEYVVGGKNLPELNWNRRQVKNGIISILFHQMPLNTCRLILCLAFQTALGLAESEADEAGEQTCSRCKNSNHRFADCANQCSEKMGKTVFLAKRHFEQVTSMAQEFQNYRKAPRGLEGSRL